MSEIKTAIPIGPDIRSDYRQGPLTRLIRRVPGMSGFSVRYTANRIQYILSRKLIRAFRFAELVLGVSFVRITAWTLAMVDSLLRADEWAYFCRLHSRLPGVFRNGASASRMYRQMMSSWHAGILVSFLYDRLRCKRWASRVAFLGFDPMAVRKEKQPILFTFLHAGPYISCLAWGRSAGLPLASYIAVRPTFLREGYGPFLDRGNALYGLSHVPMAYFSGARKELLALSRGMKNGAVISMPLDGGPGNPNLSVHTSGGTLELYDGPIRLAIAHNALLVPLAVIEEKPLRYKIYFCNPAPEELVQAGDIQAIANHLIGEIMPMLEKNPSALTWTILEAFSRDAMRWRRRWP